ncbi:MAG: hypothetical protein LBJ67_11660 [Planctomycetaceae bacterium]|nr:hypothetical protein [Planctomycetaceae bacterium]
MRPTSSPQQSGQSEIFNRRLDDFLYETHEIIQLAQHVDWNLFDRHYDSPYHPNHGVPTLPTRRMVSLLFLQLTIQKTIRIAKEQK